MLFPFWGAAQNAFINLIDSAVTIQSDIGLDSLVMRHIRANEMRDGFDGHRVQLFSGSGTDARHIANDLRAEFLNHFPQVPAYLIYISPNFKVRVGDARTKLEAIRLQRRLSYRFPGGFVVRDVVKFPVLEIDRDVDNNREDIPKDE